MEKNIRLLIIYTGGTIGSRPRKGGDPGGPLDAAPWDEIRPSVPALDDLPFAVEFLPLEAIDSSCMTPAYWLRLAREISAAHAEFDGFVILHGTDTMAWTASALSFLLENLGKPVVLTGARRPLGTPRSDAGANLRGAMLAAAQGELSEVCVFFDRLLLRGNRSTKTGGARALFESPHCPPLGRMRRGELSLEFDQVRPWPAPGEGLRVHDRLCTGVAVVNLFPGLRAEALRRALEGDELRAAVLRTFGSGNAPDTPQFHAVIEWAVRERGLLVVNVTQCLYGRVDMGRYGPGAALAERGVVSGGDMTTEAAVTKLMFLFGRGMEAGEAARQFLKNLRGERREAN
ncbi:MAG: asparaginase [Candidatus Sumerlaeia bacterium]